MNRILESQLRGLDEAIKRMQERQCGPKRRPLAVTRPRTLSSSAATGTPDPATKIERHPWRPGGMPESYEIGFKGVGRPVSAMVPTAATSRARQPKPLLRKRRAKPYVTAARMRSAPRAREDRAPARKRETGSPERPRNPAVTAVSPPRVAIQPCTAPPTISMPRSLSDLQSESEITTESFREKLRAVYATIQAATRAVEVACKQAGAIPDAACADGVPNAAQGTTESARAATSSGTARRERQPSPLEPNAAAELAREVTSRVEMASVDRASLVSRVMASPGVAANSAGEAASTARALDEPTSTDEASLLPRVRDPPAGAEHAYAGTRADARSVGDLDELALPLDIDLWPRSCSHAARLGGLAGLASASAEGLAAGGQHSAILAGLREGPSRPGHWGGDVLGDVSVAENDAACGDESAVRQFPRLSGAEGRAATTTSSRAGWRGRAAAPAPTRSRLDRSEGVTLSSGSEAGGAIESSELALELAREAADVHAQWRRLQERGLLP